MTTQPDVSTEPGVPPLTQEVRTPVQAVTQAPARMNGRQRLALIVLLAASFTLAVDFSILNVALPAIGADVGFSLENLQWIATAFALCAAGLTLLFGRVADIAGRRRMFIIGMALLGAASLAGGLAADPALLLIARVGQGIATAIVVPAALSLLLASFPEGPLRDKALGLNGSLMAAGFTTGAILGGLLTDLLSWRWAFFINVPVAVAVFIIAPIVLGESKPTTKLKLDVPGAITVTLGLLALVFGLTNAAEHSWTDPLTLGSLAAAVVLFVAFVAVERKAPSPLVPLEILKRSTVAWGNIAGILAFVTETSLVFLLTLYLQQVLGYTPLGPGLAFAVLGRARPGYGAGHNEPADRHHHGYSDHERHLHRRDPGYRKQRRSGRPQRCHNGNLGERRPVPGHGSGSGLVPPPAGRPTRRPLSPRGRRTREPGCATGRFRSRRSG